MFLAAKQISYTLQIRSNDDFNSLFCKHVVQELHIPVARKNFHEGLEEDQNLRSITSLLDACPLSSACSGAIMSHIQRTNSLPEPSQREYESVILALEIHEVANSMVIDSETAQALGIFDRESHASVFSSRTKEGLSLFSLLSAGLSRPAKQQMSQWLTFPSVTIDVINARLDAVQLFSNSRFNTSTEELVKRIKGMKNIYSMASSLISDKATIHTWKGITDFADSAIHIGLACQDFQRQENIFIFEQVTSLFDQEQLAFVHETIGAIIDLTESTFAQRIVVKRGLDAELDDCRKTYANLAGILENLTREFVEDLEIELKDSFNVTTEYFPQIGFVTSLHRKDGFAIDQTTVIAGQDQGWSYQYGSEIKAYFKNGFTRELDANIGDLHSLISGREIEIIAELQAEITKRVPMLIACGDIIAEMECLLAFAAIAAQNSYTRPELVCEPIFDIQDGRHPLQELIVETFIPNDCTLVGGKGVREEGTISEEADREHNSVMILTGANACGKSTYMKQLAMIVIMAQIGCFVPARFARIGLVDKIFTRMQVDESISASKGSFQTDMDQVSNALNRCTPHSLLLFDEMCKGTLATDGVALFAGTIRHLLRRGKDCPRTIAATHFHEVFHEDLLSPSMPITPAHMRILLDTDLSGKGKDEYEEGDDKDVEQTIVFLYKLCYGIELHSHAVQCAKLCGIRQEVIDRATHVAKKSRDHDLKSLELSIIDDLAEIDFFDANEQDRQPPSASIYTLRQKEQALRAFTAWNIDADRQTAAEEGEMAFLDPAVKLQRILNVPRVIQTTSTDPPTESRYTSSMMSS